MKIRKNKRRISTYHLLSLTIIRMSNAGMIDSLFWFRMLLSFLVGSLWIVLTTYLGDRFGSRIGGFIGGLPSTVAVSLFFIGLSQSPQAAAEATTVFPLSYAFTGLFLIVYALVWRRGFPFALSFALGAWFALSAGVVIFKLENFPVSVAAYVVFFALAVYLLEFRLRISLPRQEKDEIHGAADPWARRVRGPGGCARRVPGQGRGTGVRGDLLGVPRRVHIGPFHQLAVAGDGVLPGID